VFLYIVYLHFFFFVFFFVFLFSVTESGETDSRKLRFFAYYLQTSNMVNEIAPALPPFTSSSSSTTSSQQSSVKKKSAKKNKKTETETELENTKIIEIEKNLSFENKNVEESLDLGFYSPRSQSDTMRQLESLGFKVC
jgi:hypothetical protein